jgi:hypothetical protein
MDTCTSLIMRETIVFLPFDGILMRNTSFRAKRASEFRAMYDPREGARVCSLVRSRRFGRAPVTFRQVSSFPHTPATFSPTDRPTRSGFSPAVLGSAGDRQRYKSWVRPRARARADCATIVLSCFSCTTSWTERAPCGDSWPVAQAAFQLATWRSRSRSERDGASHLR